MSTGADTSNIENLAYTQRQELHRAEKAQIARDVARHIPDQSSIFINLGTTTEAVAQALMQHKDLRVVTNNLNVANVMSANRDFEVIVAGGIVRARDRGIVGEATIDLMRQFYLDFAVIGISGIDRKGALLDFDYREVRVAQAIIEQANKVFLAADHSKFGDRPVVRLGHISQIDALFTDRQPPDELARVIETNSVEVHLAGQD